MQWLTMFATCSFCMHYTVPLLLSNLIYYVNLQNDVYICLYHLRVTETIDPNYPDSYAERKDKYVAIRIPREDSELRYRHREDFYDAYR